VYYKLNFFLKGPSPSKETNRDIEVTTANRLGRTIASVAKDINAESVGIVLFPGTKSAGITQLLLGMSLLVSSLSYTVQITARNEKYIIFQSGRPGISCNNIYSS
jgi:hypothetical protein